ncbi:c-type cytochrome [Aquabacterium sp.]|uniref:c-type cytochrome n=1 Tax=Aquabacterium sp. TaxID=1872578 RepID=UPI002C91D94D|nr:cytochrome c [Aquabacterium sp.]HSW09242.1 cytochrome c [Aquabacterium sp.]
MTPTLSPRVRPLLVMAAAGAIVATSIGVWAQQAPKPENLIRWRQSAYQVVAWNTGRIKASVDGSYNKDEVIKAANTIAALANTGLGTLFVPGTETGKGWHDTSVKPALFTDAKRVAELQASFTKEANELAKLALTGDAAAVKEQHGKLTRTCKACHDDFRNSN